MTELKDQLSLLGRKTEYKQDYAPEVLEAFDNRHPENDYWVRFNCPEFTSLCPITGQPDFAEIRISYIPDIKMGESKSLKLYLFSFRSHGAVSYTHLAITRITSASATSFTKMQTASTPCVSSTLFLFRCPL